VLFGVNLFGSWIVLLCLFIILYIGFLLSLTQLLLVFLRQILICFKSLLRWLMINCGFQGIKLIMTIMYQMPFLFQLLSTNLSWNITSLVYYLIRNPEVWKKPTFPFDKINYDIAIRPSFSAQATVIRNSSGVVIKCNSLISSPFTTLFGEARATLLVVQLALSLCRFLLLS
jgi:hypothetical protein